MANNQNKTHKEKHTRTLIKTISWRIIATMTTFFAVYFFTHKETVSLSVAGVDAVAKILFYYFHERAWNKISWGKPKHPLSSLPVKEELAPEDMEKVKQQLKDLGYID